MLILLVCFTTTAVYRLVEAVVRDESVVNQLDVDVSAMSVDRIVHLAMTAIQLIIVITSEVDATTCYIAQALWVQLVHGRDGDRRPWKLALAAGAGAAWWLAQPYSLLASSMAYYNMLSIGYYAADLGAWRTTACAVQLAGSALFWLAMFVGFTQNPQPLDCALLPLLFVHDSGALLDWLNRAAACKSDAKSHAL
jgi:hypothetical protein